MFRDTLPLCVLISSHSGKAGAQFQQLHAVRRPFLTPFLEKRWCLRTEGDRLVAGPARESSFLGQSFSELSEKRKEELCALAGSSWAQSQS